MFSLKSIKFLGLFAFALVMSSACRYCQKSGLEAPTPAPFVAEELKSEIPFSTKEPEIFQVEIVITANNRESKIFAARSADRRRFDSNFGAKNQISYLTAGKNQMLLPGKKVYTENAADGSAGGESWTDFLTVQWLSAKADVRFASEGRENNLAKYRATFGEAGNAASDTLIFVDESVGLPVRQEFYSLAGGGRTLMMTVEFRNLKLEAEDALFSVPKDFRKVSPEEFKSILRKENE